MEFRFLVAKKDIRGIPGLKKGDAVVRVAVEVLQGGYEYDVWHRIDNGLSAKTRIEHREDLDEVTVEGYTREEVLEKVAEVASRIK